MYQQIFIFFYALLVLCLVGIILFFITAFRKELEFEEKEKQTLRSYQKILFNAHKSARKILARAARSGSTMRHESEETNLLIKKLVDNVVKQSIDDLLSLYHEDMSQMQKDMKLQIQDMLDQMRSTTQTNIQDLKNTLKDQTISIHQEISDQAKREFLALQQELSEYKKEKITTIDASMNDLIKKAAQEAFKKNLSPAMQQELISAAIENAKKEIISIDEII